MVLVGETCKYTKVEGRGVYSWRDLLDTTADWRDMVFFLGRPACVNSHFCASSELSLQTSCTTHHSVLPPLSTSASMPPC